MTTPTSPPQSSRLKRTDSVGDDWVQFFATHDAPQNYKEKREKMHSFAEEHFKKQTKVVLITSGGTAVPMESRTVRFIDNFSSGTRGAASAEYFLSEGYAVIFLFRHKSLEPYMRHFSRHSFLDMLQIDSETDNSQIITVDQTKAPNMLELLKSYQTVKTSKRLLSVEYVFLQEYLYLLRAAAEALHFAGSKAMFYLAAAVSDFYIPGQDMPEHKIQSSDGPPQISLCKVPKMLAPLVRHWATKAFVTSFKLETDKDLLLKKARQALIKFNHQVVIANILEDRRRQVTIVTQDKHFTISLTEEELSHEADIEEHIVKKLTEQHAQFITENGNGST
ncbi:phosphopantothenate--cysteine ligase-like [Amphiura filiformis]|uniref:phosphopantothenate--cysteine ligase-like n=1 Tax=Amphiura filiformis TaxID=82378 RepID=UPI003B20D4E4